MAELSDNKKVWRTLEKFHNYEATECGKVRLIEKTTRHILVNKRTSSGLVRGGKGPILMYGRRDGRVGLTHPANGKRVTFTLDQILEMRNGSVD